MLTALAADECGTLVPPPTVRMATAFSDSGRHKKENASGTAHDDEDHRYSLFNLTSSAGNKRQKVVGGPSRVIDLEEEPKNAPVSHTESLTTLLQENKEN